MKHTKIASYLAAIFIFVYTNAIGQPDSSQLKIRLNQIGFYPSAEKKAIIPGADTGEFYLKDISNRKVFSGRLTFATKPGFSGKKTAIANFSAFKKIGTYYVFIPSIGNSYRFNIKPSVHDSAATSTLKAFYFQRASINLDKAYAGKWQRAAGHPDDKILIHPSAADIKRPAGFIISSPRGWYDAGDYNKYIVNSGISTATLLSLYEDFPEHMKKVKLNIPESNNNLPDILDEVLWNLRWMLTMQDPGDGGVYHKLTNAEFDKMIMPDKAIKTRFAVQKSTAAALNFAAVTAKASRIFSAFNRQLPGLTDSCLKASLSAYTWAINHPEAIYDQNAINKQFEPKIITGAYQDKSVKDEFFWAAAELYATTGDSVYLEKVIALDDPTFSLPTWSNVKLLGYYTLAEIKSTNKTIDIIKMRMLNFAKNLVANAEENSYQTVMGKSAANFNWGSNANAANQGILLIKTYKLTNDQTYLNYALANLDYILGRNGTGYSYLTGYGSKPPMHPHHRPSIADGIVEPIPGLMAGGPNPGMQDSIKLVSLAPDEAYIDDSESYATNEIAINWNAPIGYLANAIEALQKQLSLSSAGKDRREVKGK